MGSWKSGLQMQPYRSLALSTAASSQTAPLALSSVSARFPALTHERVFRWAPQIAQSLTEPLQRPLWRIKGSILPVQPLQTAPLLLFAWQLACCKTLEQKDPNPLKVWKSPTQTFAKVLHTKNVSTSIKWRWQLVCRWLKGHHSILCWGKHVEHGRHLMC